MKYVIFVFQMIEFCFYLGVNRVSQKMSNNEFRVFYYVEGFFLVQGVSTLTLFTKS